MSNRKLTAVVPDQMRRSGNARMGFFSGGDGARRGALGARGRRGLARRAATPGGKRAVVLGLVAAGTLAAAIAVPLSMSGGGGPSAQHKAVAAYVKRVDAIEGRQSLALGRVRNAFHGLTGAQGSTNARALARSEQTLRALRHRLATADAPPAAATLRHLFVQLAGEDVEIAHEVRLLALFLPGFRTASSLTRAAASRLGQDLAAVKPPRVHSVTGTAKQVAAAQAAYKAAASAAAARQATAVDRYDAVLGRALVELRTLRPPPALAPAYRAQAAMLRATRAAGATLAAALRSSDRSRVPLLNRRFVEATRLAVSLRAQTAEIAAIKAYDARVERTRRVQLAIQGELRRLQLTVR